MTAPVETAITLAALALVFLGFFCFPPACPRCRARDWDTRELPKQRTCRKCGHRIRG